MVFTPAHEIWDEDDSPAPAGQHTIWPDRFAELVRDTVGAPFRALLDEPRQVMTAVHAAFRESTAPGS